MRTPSSVASGTHSFWCGHRPIISIHIGRGVWSMQILTYIRFRMRIGSKSPLVSSCQPLTCFHHNMVTGNRLPPTKAQNCWASHTSNYSERRGLWSLVPLMGKYNRDSLCCYITAYVVILHLMALYSNLCRYITAYVGILHLMALYCNLCRYITAYVVILHLHICNRSYRKSLNKIK